MGKERKKATIYLPNMVGGLNKELQDKQKSIVETLKGTPFEQDTNIIFEHLCKVQGALHITNANIYAKVEYLQKDLDLVNTLIALHYLKQGQKMDVGDINSCAFPKEVVASATVAAIDLYNNNINVCMGGAGKYTNELSENAQEHKFSEHQDDFFHIEVQEYKEPSIEHLRRKKKEIEKQMQKKAGKLTSLKETPCQLTDTFKQVCAIDIFCKCDGFGIWDRKSERNRCIFKCLMDFGYIPHNECPDANTQRSRIRDAENYDFVFVSPPI